MLTNATFATTVAVAVPVILLALGAESRELDKRTRPQRNFTPFLTDLAIRNVKPAERFLESFPDASPDWTVEQTRPQWANYRRWVHNNSVSFISVAGAVPRVYLTTLLWAFTIASLSVTEVWTLVWLSTQHPETGDSPTLAWLSVISCSLSMVLLFAVPALRLLWFQIPTTSTFDPQLPDSFWQVLERKFGLPSHATKEERQQWLEMMNSPPQRSDGHEQDLD